MLTGKKAIIFDLDGTLIDSVSIWNQVDKKLISELGGSFDGIDVGARRDAKLREFKAFDTPTVSTVHFWEKSTLPISPPTRLSLCDIK